MENNLSDKVKKKIKSGKKAIIAIIILIIIIGILFYIPTILPEQMPKEPKEMLKLVEDGLLEDTIYSDEYAKLDVEFLSGEVASYGEVGSAIKDRRYYIAWDKKDYKYIVSVPDSYLYDELDGIYYLTYNADEEDTENTKTVDIEGITKEIPAELKSIVLEIMQDEYPDSEITADNFEYYFGSIYLDANKGPYDTYNGICWGVATVLIIITITVFALTISNLVVTKKTMKKLKKNNRIEEVFEQIDSTDTISFEVINTYLTRNYIVDCSGGFTVIEYENIKWIYKFVQRLNYVEAHASVLIRTKDCKQFNIAQMHSTQINHKLLERIIEELEKKCPNAMIGFSKENQQEFKNYKKELKK